LNVDIKAERKEVAVRVPRVLWATGTLGGGFFRKDGPYNDLCWPFDSVV